MVTWALAPPLRALVPVLAGAVDLALCHSDNKKSVAVPVILIAVCATLYARFRQPVAVLAVHLGWTLSAALFWNAAPVAGLLVALYALTVSRPVRLSASGLVLTAATLTVEVEAWRHDSFDWVAPVLVPVGVWALGSLVVRLRIDAVRTERLRIARDLHDVVSHALSGIVVQAAGAKAVLPVDPGRAATALGAIEGAGVQAMDEMHRMLGLLRSAGAGDDDRRLRQPGLENVGTLLDWARDNGLKPTTVVDGEPSRLDDGTSLTAYRIVQEALTNALKHEGPEAAVTLRLSWSDADLTISVENRSDHLSPTGRPGLRGGYGLTGLRERVQTVGGTFQTQVLDHGFRVSARLPLAADGRGPVR
jgi:signal transduction histidine kinase